MLRLAPSAPPARALVIVIALASGASLPACFRSVKPPEASQPERGGATQPPAADERRATVRIDPAPSHKRFQGVWLELDGGARWLIDYRTNEMWRAFEDRAVLVTGRCYEPAGQAIGATHFEVERMRFADGRRPDAPILALGPETRMRGVFAELAYPAGSKLAGETYLVFRDDGGVEHRPFGAERGRLRLGERVAIDARPVERNLAYTAGPGGPHLWLLHVLPADAGEPDRGRAYGPCPAL